MASRVSMDTSYNFRPRPQGDQSLSSAGRIYRQLLTPSKSASLIGKTGHHCDHVDEESTLTKTETRLMYSIHRFAIAYAWGCTTSRGRTQYNGARAHCGISQCEAAHAALSPTLHDDMLQKVSEQFNTKTFSGLDEISKIYMQKRFAMNEKDMQSLDDQNGKTRLTNFQVIVKRLIPQEAKGSFVGTSVEFQRNATYNNPKSSNRLDCYLERELRGLEDQLAQECTDQTIDPEGAILRLQKKYDDLLSSASRDLTAASNRLVQLSKAWQDLITMQNKLQDSLSLLPSQPFADYIQRVKAYLKAYDVLKNQPLKGAPKLQTMMNYFRCQQSYYVLKGVERLGEANSDKGKDYFFKNKHHLKISNGDMAKFEEGILEIKKRLKEVEIQSEVIKSTPEDIHLMFKSMFGKKQEAILKTPLQPDVAARLVETLPSLTPSRSDLNKNLRGPILLPPDLTANLPLKVRGVLKTSLFQ
jgi:hypothetical protein